VALLQCYFFFIHTGIWFCIHGTVYCRHHYLHLHFDAKRGNQFREHGKCYIIRNLTRENQNFRWFKDWTVFVCIRSFGRLHMQYIYMYAWPYMVIQGVPKRVNRYIFQIFTRLIISGIENLIYKRWIVQ
jgi:hypothetical protein